jgi:betaine-aldehyde dehydrogenase
VASCFSYYADLAEKLDGRQWQPVDVGEDGFKSAIRREPLGVVVRGQCGFRWTA